MQPADYDAWYRTPRGGWVGETEYNLLWRMLAPQAGESLLDAGCGTGYFTRRFAAAGKLAVTGIDLDAAAIAYAGNHAAGGENYVAGSALALPFADRQFDLSISVTALCFIREQQQALREILRVTRKRFSIGLLNRHSLLYLQKGRAGGKGAYRGAHWHTAAEIRELFGEMPVRDLHICTAVFLPGGGWLARRVESLAPQTWPWGAFIVIAGRI